MPQIVSPYNDAKINIKILVIIGLGAILVQYYVEISDDPELLIIAVSLTSQFLVAIFALLISKRCWDSKIFGRSYLLLAIAYFFVFAGEITYNVYAFAFDADPYPSVADLFFFMLYPLSFGHIMINVKSFRLKSTRIEKFLIIGIIIFTIAMFVSLSYSANVKFDFDVYYGLVFVGGAAVIMAFGMYGIIVTKNIPLGRMWLLLVVGITFGTIGDIWYHHLELLESYDTSGIVNVFWYLSYWIIAYSLYKHGKII